MIRTYGLWDWNNQQVFGFFVADAFNMPVKWDKLLAGDKKLLMNWPGAQVESAKRLMETFNGRAAEKPVG